MGAEYCVPQDDVLLLLSSQGAILEAKAVGHGVEEEPAAWQLCLPLPPSLGLSASQDPLPVICLPSAKPPWDSLEKLTKGTMYQAACASLLAKEFSVVSA